MKITLDRKQIDKNLKDIALAIRKEILAKTRKGVDMNGVQFKKYSPLYQRLKEEYTGEGRANTVNLLRTGVMLDSISITKEGNAFVIYIADPTRKIVAFAHHTGSGQPKRAFFGISKDKEKEFFNRYFKKEILVKQ